MKSFSQFLSEASVAGKNVHMAHIEDQVLYGGVKGAREAILALRALRDMLAGGSSGARDVTVKWDGAPAIFCGTDPSDGKFFVAKKGIFNKNPKVYKTPEDVKSDTSGDLQQKMLLALEHLSKLGITGIVQGDLMFTSGDVKRETIEGEKFLTFQPNTIVYAVPTNTDLASEIAAAKIGIVFHTSYSGNSFENLTASFGVDVKKFKPSRDVWYRDARLQDLSGKATLTKSDSAEVTLALSEAGKIFAQISGSTLRAIESNPDLAAQLETYNNSLTRRGDKVANTARHVEGLILWFNSKYEKERNEKKTLRGKSAVSAREEEFMSFFSIENLDNLKKIYDLQNAIVTAKEIIIDKLNRLSRMNTFIRTKNGFRVTGQEGFVAIDHENGKAVKLVDRLEFSYANFSPDTIRGWQRS
jgi:hypothetical protein